MVSPPRPAPPGPVAVVVFDFDGVLVDSVDIKTRAFASLYGPHGPDVVAQVRAHHLAHGGISRYEKLEHYERVLLGRDPIPADIDGLADAFARQVVEQVVAAREVPGAGELLADLHGLVPLYVASGTPEVELVEIVDRRGWARWFRAVHGSPRSKQEILTAIAQFEAVEPGRVLMVGDATTDLDGAVAAATQFVGLVTSGEAADDPFPDGTEVAVSLDGVGRTIRLRGISRSV